MWSLDGKTQKLRWEDVGSGFCGKDFDFVRVFFASVPVQDLQEQKGKLEKHRKDDLKDGQQEKERLKTLTLGCVKQLG